LTPDFVQQRGRRRCLRTHWSLHRHDVAAGRPAAGAGTAADGLPGSRVVDPAEVRAWSTRPPPPPREV